MEKRKQPAHPRPQPSALEGSILTDLSFQPVAADRGAQALIITWDSGNGCRDANRTLPPDLLAALRDRPLNELADVHAHFRIGSIGYICRVSVMNPCSSEDSQPLLALHIQRSPEVNEAIRKIAEEFDLTDREYEALQNISAGLTCKEVAEKMSISPNTVKAFLRLIMIKMGVSRRVGILSKVLELTQQANGNGSSKQA